MGGLSRVAKGTRISIPIVAQYSHFRKGRSVRRAFAKMAQCLP
jgi:hypothetical protein